MEAVVAIVEETMIRQREAKQHLGLWLLLLMIDQKLTCSSLAPTEKDINFSLFSLGVRLRRSFAMDLGGASPCTNKLD